MKKITIICLFIFGLILLCPGNTSAQEDFEYGKPAELKGLKKIFIDAGPDTENFERIKKAIEKAALPGVEIVESSDEAEVVVSFRAWRETAAARGTTYKENAGKGFVAIPSADKKKLRVLFNFESVEDKLGEQKPATKFARKFIEEYRKANGLKK